MTSMKTLPTLFILIAQSADPTDLAERIGSKLDTLVGIEDGRGCFALSLMQGVEADTVPLDYWITSKCMT